MKKFYAILMTMVISANVFAADLADGRALYNKFSDEQGVSAVFISSTMFRMMGRIPALSVGSEEVELSQIIKSLTGLYILSVEDNPKVSAALKGEADKYISSGKFELLMEVKDSGETTRIYTVNKGDVITSFVLLTAEADETNFICFEGAIPQDAFDRLIEEASK